MNNIEKQTDTDTKDVLLVKLDIEGTPMYPPYGLLYVASALLKAGHTVKIFHEAYSKTAFDKLMDTISTTKPRLIGFSVVTDLTLRFAVNSTREINRKFPDIPIVWGGVHATSFPEMCMSEPSVKYVVVGEGEKPVVELMNELSKESPMVKDIAGLGYRLDGNIHVNERPGLVEDLDSYPIPWDLVGVDRYLMNGSIAFSTSRGCPFNCGFCFNSFMYKRRMRTHSIEYVMENINLFRKHGITSIEYLDASFLANRKRAFAIVEKVNLPFKIETRADEIDENVADFLKKYNCNCVFIGVESGSERLLKMVDKKTDKSVFRNSFKLLSDRGINIIASFIVGLPDEKDEDLNDTIDFMVELYDDYNAGIAGAKIYSPYPMTPLYEKTLELGWIPPTTNEGWSKMVRLRECDLPWVRQKKVVEGLYALMLILQSNSKLGKLVRWRLQKKRFELLFEPNLIEWYAKFKKTVFKSRILGTKTASSL